MTVSGPIMVVPSVAVAGATGLLQVMRAHSIFWPRICSLLRAERKLRIAGADHTSCSMQRHKSPAATAVVGARSLR